MDFHKVSTDDAANARAESYEKPIVLHEEMDGINSSWAKEYLKTLQEKTKIPMQKSDEDRVSSVLKALWKMFEQCEGVWFTGELHVDSTKNKAIL